MLLSTLEALEFALSRKVLEAVLSAELKAWEARMKARPFYAAYVSQAKPQLFPSMTAA